MKKTGLIFIIFILLQNSLYAQSENTERLLMVTLPPIEQLFESAKNSSTIEYYETRKEAEELILKSEKRKWLGYFNLFGSYQYGVMGMNMYNNEGLGTPIINQYSGSQQMWYNFGGAIRIPLDNFFDRRNKIKTQKKRIEEADNAKGQWYENQKLKIIELYTKAEEMLSVLKNLIEQSNLGNAQFEIAQKDYIAGNITAQALNISKNQQVQANMELARIKSELYRSILQLEILSNTKIIVK